MLLFEGVEGEERKVVFTLLRGRVIASLLPLQVASCSPSTE